ncbi:MAG: hypothetical protein WBD55_06010 [Dehalococcoidia bacterium]
MVYALVITIAAALLILAAIAGGTLLVRQAAGHSVPTLGRWRFYPSPIGLLVLPLLAALVFLRFVPGLLFIPFVLPFALRGRRFWGGRRRRNEPTNGRNSGESVDESTIEGQYRNLDDE